MQDEIDKHDRADYVVTKKQLLHYPTTNLGRRDQDQTTRIMSQPELTARANLDEPKKQDAVAEVLFLHPATAKTTQVSVQARASTSNRHRMHVWMRLNAR